MMANVGPKLDKRKEGGWSYENEPRSSYFGLEGLAGKIHPIVLHCFMFWRIGFFAVPGL
jgi:hypothetical protein